MSHTVFSVYISIALCKKSPWVFSPLQTSVHRRRCGPRWAWSDIQKQDEKQNKRYYKLIKEFEKQTSIPMLLNTSFNENEPIVCYPSEAIDCFLRTKMDKLYLENYLIYRS